MRRWKGNLWLLPRTRKSDRNNKPTFLTRLFICTWYWADGSRWVTRARIRKALLPPARGVSAVQRGSRKPRSRPRFCFSLNHNKSWQAGRNNIPPGPLGLHFHGSGLLFPLVTCFRIDQVALNCASSRGAIQEELAAICSIEKRFLVLFCCCCNGDRRALQVPAQTLTNDRYFHRRRQHFWSVGFAK